MSRYKQSRKATNRDEMYKVNAIIITPELKEKILKYGVRTFATGGLVVGEDNVPNTKEDPADRKDPNTGRPYSDQMTRLGLSEGGILTIEPRAIQNNNPLNMSLGSIDEESNMFVPYDGVAKYSGVVGIDKENLGGLRKDGVTKQLETFAKFKDVESGARANFMNLTKNYNGLTLGEIVQNFSRTDKDTYAKNASKFSNVPVDKIINFKNDEETAIKVFKGMHRLEAGKYDERITDEMLSEAWKDSKISRPDSEYSKTQWKLDKDKIAKELGNLIIN